jgi:hypothetical protein
VQDLNSKVNATSWNFFIVWINSSFDVLIFFKIIDFLLKRKEKNILGNVFLWKLEPFKYFHLSSQTHLTFFASQKTQEECKNDVGVI